MESTKSSSLLELIEYDLAKTKKELLANAFSGHKLLADQLRDIKNLPLASLLLVSASFGNYKSDELIPVAVGLELLRLAAETHYRGLDEDGRASDVSARNLSLITADNYYARAINIAAPLKKGYIVEFMVKAIADIAEAEISKLETGAQSSDLNSVVAEKHLSLFRSAVKLGLLISNCSLDIEGILINFASLFGYIYHIVYAAQGKDLALIDHLGDVKNQAALLLRNLPKEQGSLLENMLAAI